jgi:gas vesicle protein
MKDTGKLLLAVMAGAAIGTAIGILFAPGKGEDTRKEIMDGADELANSFKEKLKETSDMIDELKEKIFEGTDISQNGGKTNGSKHA